MTGRTRPPQPRTEPPAPPHRQREALHERPNSTVGFDSGGVDELGVMPWPILLRRRLAEKIGLPAQWAVLWVVLAGLFTVSFTITILVVSLPRIADDLDSSTTTLTWVITGPMLAFGVVGPAFGKAGDLFGHKRIFVLGLLFAGLFAALTAVAWSATTMILFRVLSASAGSACGPSAMAYINRMFAPEDRVKPLGYWSFVTAGAPVLGVVAGGPLVEHIGWRAIFALQAPLCIAGVVVALWLLPNTERMKGVRFDVKGSLTLGVGATLILAGVSQGPRWGWGSASTITCFGLGVVALAVFVQIEKRVADPLVVLAWFRTRNVAFPVLSQTLLNFAYMGGFIIAPRVLQEGLGFTESKTGFLIIARPLVFSIVAPLAGLLTFRIGERIAGVGGGILVVASMLCWAVLGEASPMWFIAVALGLSGAGLGAAFPALTALTANAVAETDLGVAGAMQQLMNQLGAVVGSVVLSTISVGGERGDLRPFHVAFVVAAAVATAGCVAAGFVRSTDRDRSQTCRPAAARS